jgi:hypothetical protein
VVKTETTRSDTTTVLLLGGHSILSIYEELRIIIAQSRAVSSILKCECLYCTVHGDVMGKRLSELTLLAW